MQHGGLNSNFWLQRKHNQEPDGTDRCFVEGLLFAAIRMVEQGSFYSSQKATASGAKSRVATLASGILPDDGACEGATGVSEGTDVGTTRPEGNCVGDMVGTPITDGAVGQPNDTFCRFGQHVVRGHLVVFGALGSGGRNEHC